MSGDEQLLEELRPVSFAIAYRMLGSVSEAEDIVQEALLRLHRALENGEQIQSPRAFVATVTTRRAIDQLRSARVRPRALRRPVAAGADHHRPHRRSCSAGRDGRLAVAGDAGAAGQPVPGAARRAAAPRRVDYDYARVAEIIGKSQDNVRQLARRARRHVEQRRPRFEASRDQQQELARRFFAATREGNLAGLEALLAHDVVLTGDGGGKAPAPVRSLRGRNRVARTLLNWVTVITRIPGVHLRPTEVNGSPGALLLDGQARVIGVWVLEIGRSQIQGVSSIVNPEKLAHLGLTADLTSLLRGRAPIA